MLLQSSNDARKDNRFKIQTKFALYENRRYLKFYKKKIFLMVQTMVKLVIQRYTREAGVRNLERNLAALARAAAVRVAEQEQVAPLSKNVHQLASPILENRIADGAEVEMEVIPMAVNNHEISSTFKVVSPLIVDEAMLEKVLGVIVLPAYFFSDGSF